MSAAILLAGMLLSVDGQPIDQAVRRGLEMYEAVDFRGARSVIVQALKNPDLSRGDTVAALGCLARVYAVLEQDSLARETFIKVLSIEPEHAVGDHESRRIAKAWEAARETLRAHEENPQPAAVSPPQAILPLPTGSPSSAQPTQPVRLMMNEGLPVHAPTTALDTEPEEQLVVENPPSGWEQWHWWIAAAVGVVAASVGVGLWWNYHEQSTKGHLTQPRPDVKVQLP